MANEDVFDNRISENDMKWNEWQEYVRSKIADVFQLPAEAVGDILPTQVSAAQSDVAAYSDRVATHIRRLWREHVEGFAAWWKLYIDLYEAEREAAYAALDIGWRERDDGRIEKARATSLKTVEGFSETVQPETVKELLACMQVLRGFRQQTAYIEGVDVGTFLLMAPPMMRKNLLGALVYQRMQHDDAS